MFCLTFVQGNKAGQEQFSGASLMGCQCPSRAGIAPHCHIANHQGRVLAVSVEVVIHIL